jgi:dipeptidase
MTELSNAVTVLIARMETHPEDFDMGATDAPRFGHLAPYLTKLAGGGDELAHRHTSSYVEEPFWFLSETDKEALIAAWKHYHYKAFEKRMMERVFDENYYARQEEAKLYEQQMKQQMYQQRMAMQNQLAASTGTYQTTQIQPGQIHPLQNSAIATNSNSGLLSSIFGSSK